MTLPNRRKFLAQTGTLIGATAVCPVGLAAPAGKKKKKRVAAIVTLYEHNSHADVIVGRILQSHTLDDQGTWPAKPWPNLELASMYVDQKGPKDKSVALAEKHGFRLCSTVEEAITLGTKEVAVDGVLLIGEHGKYELSETGQIMYPRRRFFEDTAAVLRRHKRSVPVFMDKHFAWNWQDAKWIYDTARELRIPLMAGSSIPVTWRRPPLELREGTRLGEALGLSYGPLEGYGFHGLEALQCIVERRKGGETGVAKVQFVEGPAVWQGGRVPEDLLEAALAVRENKGRFKGRFQDAATKLAAFFIEYVDGLSSVVLHDQGNAGNEWIVSWRERRKTELPATLFWTQEARPLGHFAFLLDGIERMIHTGRPTWPAERTLLTTGIVAALFESRKAAGKPIDTPHLAIRYRPTFTWKEPPAPPPGRPFSSQ